MAIDIWWLGGPVTVWRDGRLVSIPVGTEPEYGYDRLEMEDGEPVIAVSPNPQAVIAWVDTDTTVRFHVVPVGRDAPDWPGKRLFAHAPGPINVPPGMQVVFSPE